MQELQNSMELLLRVVRAIDRQYRTKSKVRVENHKRKRRRNVIVTLIFLQLAAVIIAVALLSFSVLPGP